MNRSNDKRLNTKASVAGGGLGTFILAAADRLPAGYELLKSFLVYSSPAIAVGAAAGWVLIAGFIRRQKRRYDMRAILKEATNKRDGLQSDPHASAAVKAAAQKHVDDLHELDMALMKDEADVVRAQLRAIR